MTEQAKTPPRKLLAGRRALEGMSSVTLLQDWTWSLHAQKWVLHCQLAPDVLIGGPIPKTTDWYVLVDESYPWGSIKFYPAKENSIVQTFPHQNYNGLGRGDVPWRAGHICLDTTVRVLGRHGYDIEPYEVHQRLQWRFRRAIQWLEAASRGELVLKGDPFELPVFPVELPSTTVVFCEGPDTFSEWLDIAVSAGLIDLCPLFGKREILVTKCFRSPRGEELLAPRWGSALEQANNETLTGIWLRTNEVLTLPPWQAPATWGELRTASHDQDVKIDNRLKSVVRRIRDSKRHIALVGSPIPARAGDAPCQMHWQALMLPRLSYGRQKANGFRPNESGYWQRDRMKLLYREAPVEWLRSENWDVKQISMRGRLSPGFASKKVLLLGAGAVGAVVAELLVRAGLQYLTIVDGDNLAAGNLVRHPLGLDQLGDPKAEAVANRLNCVTPHASVSAINTHFPPDHQSYEAQVQECEVILDCTGRDEVLYYLEVFPWNGPKLFFSISLGVQARRLFLFSAFGRTFPHSVFRDLFRPWAEKESSERGEFPRDGIGCWHPVFPARIDDVWSLSSIAIGDIELAVVAPSGVAQLIVFERYYENGGFAGIRRICSQADDV